MSTETTEIPKGVIQILLKRAESDRRDLEIRIHATHSGTERVEGKLIRVKWDTYGDWVTPTELRTIDERAAEWLSGLNAMRLAP